MSRPSKIATVARIRIHERHGIRRFLYPLTVRLPFTTSAPSRLRVAEADGALVPSEAFLRRKQTQLDFAVSLDPHENRTLLIVETDDLVTVPDPMRGERTDDGMTLRQERVASTFSEQSGLRSVIYDGVEHLAGPLTIMRDETVSSPASWEFSPVADGLSFFAVARGGDFKTRYDLTACKSWVRVTHIVADAPAETEITFTLPLTVPDETPTCDFGVGNGVYAKIGGEAVTWTVDFGRAPYACWEVAHRINGEPRLDYEGKSQGRRAFAAQAWFHWTLRARALAVAVTHIPQDCTHLRASLGKDGRIEITFRLGRRARRAKFGVCYHFLNDIAAIAAATNPASMLLPPEMKLRRLE